VVLVQVVPTLMTVTGVVLTDDANFIFPLLLDNTGKLSGH